MQSLRDIFLLRPDVIFLNHGSFGACPRPVFESYQAWQMELERQPVEFLQRRLPGLMHEVRRELGAFVNAAADDLVYVTNATTAINIVARSLPLEPGDEVLSTDHEYGSISATWTFVCRKRGAHYRPQRIPLPITSAGEVVDAIWSGVTPRTRVLAFSHVTAPTAFILPVEELVRRAREAGIITVVDGAHAPGQVPLDLKAIGADFYAGNCHKWMMAPKGAGFLHARPEMQHLLEPLVGGRKAEGAAPSRLVDEHQYHGTRDPAAALSVPAAIRFMKEHDWPAVQQACHERIRRARQALADLTGLPPVVPDARTWFSQMGVLPIPHGDANTLRQRLREEFGIEIPWTSWEDHLFLRLSVQGYNSDSDIAALLEAVAALLPQVTKNGE